MMRDSLLRRFGLRLTPLILSVSALAALWPVWRWYGLRLLDNSDEHAGVVALLTALALLYQRTSSGYKEAKQFPLTTLVLILTLYGLSFSYLPPMLRALFALGVVGTILNYYANTKQSLWGLWGLLLLSLPVMASLQFYIGFPLRWIAGAISEFLLNLAGLAVSHQGTVLVWSGGVVAIDAPCSGINMLWASMYISCVLAYWLQMSRRQFTVLILSTLAIIVAANGLRAASLFYVETGMVKLPIGGHTAIGVLMYIVALVAIYAISKQMTKKQLC